MGILQRQMHSVVNPCSNKDSVIGLPSEVALCFRAQWSITQAGVYME